MPYVENDSKVVIARVDDYGPVPRTPVEALVQAHAFLSEEGQFVTGTMFEDGDPEEAWEKSACGSWKACSMGALGLVTGEAPVSVDREFEVMDDDDVREAWVDAVNDGLTDESLATFSLTAEKERNLGFEFQFREDYDEYDTPISYGAAVILSEAIAAIANRNGEKPADDPVQAVINWNDDGEGRSGVLAVFADAIKLAGGTPIVDHEAAAKRSIDAATKRQELAERRDQAARARAEADAAALAGK